MGFELEVDEARPATAGHHARIVVIGVGGAGSNAVDRMIQQELMGVEFAAVNTDIQVLEHSAAPSKIAIGTKLTGGLGAGGNPDVGKKAAEENKDELADVLRGADMVFIAAGMGGGTGTGASPVIAEIAKEAGALTVAVATKPFEFEGSKRIHTADEGITQLQEIVDTLIIIPNQRILSIIDRDTPFIEAFALADEILHQATRGISDLIVMPGIINLDFADVRSVLSGMGGDALMGAGEAEGENRAVQAAQRAISSPMLEDISIEGAKGVLLNITGSSKTTMYELHEAASIIHEAAGNDANLIFGTAVDESMGERIRVTVIAAGFRKSQQQKYPTRRNEQTQTRHRTDAKEYLLDIFSDASFSIPTPPDPISPEPKTAPEFIPNDSAADEETTSQKTSEEVLIAPNSGGMMDFDPNDYEIPAFLRRKKKSITEQ